MKTLITFGCSFTDKINEAWPEPLSKLNNFKLINKGKSSAGNYHIAHSVYDTIYDSDNSVVIVMWSCIDRIDRAVSRGGFHYFEKWENYIKDNWLHSGGKPKFSKIYHFDRYWYNYFKAYHTDEDSHIQTLQHILGVQEFLINRKIPYLFLTYKDIFTDRYQKYEKAKNLESHINWDKFHFPNGKFGGEFEWVKDNELTFGEDGKHPSSESHQKFAEYLTKLIDKDGDLY